MSEVTADQIKAGRERRHMTQADLASEMGVSLRTVGSWERGESVPRNRVAALIEALSLEDEPKGYQWGKEAVRARIGQLVRQRREELGMSRDLLAERVGLKSKQTVMNFEFARSWPFTSTLRQIEKALEWKSGSIDEALESGKRAGDLSMEDFDAYDRTPQDRPLASYSTPDLLRELATRLESLQAGMGPAAAVAKPVDNQFLYGLAANTDPSHLERIAEEDAARKGPAGEE